MALFKNKTSLGMTQVVALDAHTHSQTHTCKEKNAMGKQEKLAKQMPAGHLKTQVTRNT